MKQGPDPDAFLYTMETARDRLHDMGEHISPKRFGDFILNALTPDYNFVRNTSIKDREFGLEDIKSTMRNIYADLLSRSSPTPSIAGRGVAMQAHHDLHSATCYLCRKFRHRKEDIPKFDPDYKKTRKEGSSKWCSLNKTTYRPDDVCRAKERSKTKKTEETRRRRGEVVLSAFDYVPFRRRVPTPKEAGQQRQLQLRQEFSATSP